MSDSSEDYDDDYLTEVVQPTGVRKVSPKGGVYWIPDVELKPIVGTQFRSIGQALSFYREYGKKGGFDVRIGGGYNPNKHDPSSKYFYCVKEGFKRKEVKPIGAKPFEGKPVEQVSQIVTQRQVDDLANDANKEIKKTSRRKRASIRTGCPARIFLKKIHGNLYEVANFVEHHNHYLVDKCDAIHLRSNRNLAYTQKILLHQVSNINMGPVRGFKLMKQIFGGFEAVGASVVDCKNFKRDLNRYIGEQDAQMCVSKLLDLKEFNNGFSADWFSDPDGTLGGIFWADSESKRYYSMFGDVVSFDATFRSNRYQMVFVPFTGIDNHNKCITFGGGLLHNETYESYKWLLECFQKAFGVDPKVFVTDQDKSMKKAIAEVFPNTRHRLCMWHIMKKLSIKIAPRLKTDKVFKKRLCSIVWTDKIDPEFFEREWHSIMAEYHIEGNKWLSKIFALRRDWIPAFFRDEPMSGLMRTSSRSESENYFFGQLTNSYLTLVEFLSHFETSMDSQRFSHSKNEHDSRYTNPDMRTDLLIERRAAEIFTRPIFYDIQDEIYASMVSCYSKSCVPVDGSLLFSICDNEDVHIDPNSFFDISRQRYYKVVFNPSEMTFSCSCKKFECFGILCRHVFYVFKVYKINDIPKKYILSRWSKNALPLKPYKKSLSGGLKTNVAESVIREIYSCVDSVINRLVTDMNKLNLYRDQQKEITEKYESEYPIVTEINKDEMFASLLGVRVPDQINVHNPKGVRNKGSGSHSRYKSADELAHGKSTKFYRTCSVCKLSDGHNKSTCSKRFEVASTLSSEGNYSRNITSSFSSVDGPI